MIWIAGLQLTLTLLHRAATTYIVQYRLTMRAPSSDQHGVTSTDSSCIAVSFDVESDVVLPAIVSLS